MLLLVLTKPLCVGRILALIIYIYILFFIFVVKVQAIVYCTSSVYPEENELVVKKALESGVEGHKLKRFRYEISSP